MHSQVEAFLHTTATSRHSSLTVLESLKVKDKRTHGHEDVARVTDLSQNGRNSLQEINRSSGSITRGAVSHHSAEHGSISDESSTMRNGKKEVIEQFEPGVYVTVILLQNGTKIFKRVRFRYLSKYLSKLKYKIHFYIECVCTRAYICTCVYMYGSQFYYLFLFLFFLQHVCVYCPLHVS